MMKVFGVPNDLWSISIGVFSRVSSEKMKNTNTPLSSSDNKFTQKKVKKLQKQLQKKENKKIAKYSFTEYLKQHQGPQSPWNIHIPTSK